MPTNVTVPPVGESIKTVILSKWLRHAGDSVTKGASVAEIDSDKATLEIPAPTDGVLVEVMAAEGEEVSIGAVIGRIEDGAKGAPASTENGHDAPAAKKTPKAGPAVRQHAAEGGVDLGAVEGTGPRGQITRQDVDRVGDTKPPPAAKAPPPQAEGRVERVPMSPLRRTIARRLVEVQQTAAMLTTFNEVDMGAVMTLRKRYQEAFVEKYGIKLGMMSFFVKASIEALKAHPAVNAEIQGNDILYKHYFNIGVAVSAPKGLMVPVLREADHLSLAETERAIGGLAQRARENKLVPDDFLDGTFTITNGGVFGSMLSTPILNPPQVGILGMHNIVDRPVARDGQVVIRPTMYVALSYDHRIIDGREAVGFLVRVKELIEAPERILLEV
jgi:2-oxoglutarate dehydrogenase E2 component (dihydrolipoamide succinyltransferase)